MPLFGGEDVGWAGAFEPMIVSKACLDELRNFAGPPQYPGQRMFQIDLVTGQVKWQTRPRRSGRKYSRRR